MIDNKFFFSKFNIILKKIMDRKYNIDIYPINILIFNKKKILKKINLLNYKKKKISKIFKIIKNQKIIDRIIKISLKLNKIIYKNKNKLIKINDDLNNILLNIPNIIDNDVPLNFNKCIKYFNENKKKYDFNIKNYLEISNKKIDFKIVNNISNFKSVIMKEDMALLNRALISFMIENHIKNGYKEIYVPLIVNKKSLYNTAQLPKFYKDLIYVNNFNNLNNDDNILIPTSEVSLVNIFIKKIINKNEMPIKLTSYTPCFRYESKFYGKNKKGLIKLNQFDKVEIIQIVNVDSNKYLNEISNDVENIIKLLELPYRKILLCSHETPFSSSKTFDFEIYFPNLNKYIEVSSCSNTKDFQSRRLLLKYKDENNKMVFPHILNASGLAINRTIAAIIENYQLKNGNVEIPKNLIPYMMGKKYIKMK